MTSLLQRDGGGRFALSGAVNQVVICNEFACAMQIYGRQLQVPDVTHFQIDCRAGSQGDAVCDLGQDWIHVYHVC